MDAQNNKQSGKTSPDNGGNASAKSQADMDRASANAIELRSIARSNAGATVDAAADRQMAVADAHAFKHIREAWIQEDAAINMAEIARQSPDYKTALDIAVPGTTAVIDALDKANDAKMLAKEERKGAILASAGGITAPTLNAIEQGVEKQQQQLSSEQDAKRSAWLYKAGVQATPAAAPGNQLESDEIFTASQRDVKPLVPSDIENQYLRVGDKFYHPKNTDMVAFEDKGNKLETRSNSEAIAESMVRIAQARGWDEIKVTGSEVFRREVWLEAATRGMHVKGYTPSDQDKAALAKRGVGTERNQVEQGTPTQRTQADDAEARMRDSRSKQMAQAFASQSAVAAVMKHPELAGTVAAVAAMDLKAQADGLTSEQRRVVAARVRHNVINSIGHGSVPDIPLQEPVAVQREAKARNEDKEYTR